ncbi:hypothetical protein H5410_023395 [Solanum commersonii]|uniref:Uncharacterized protein n=1 Tax=Solanum commersonii TaxID=4109 RepID=A0A9J5ZHF4_SOLCO|nr:hypothetical protein H5410_023395 [Solanum commersonii]
MDEICALYEKKIKELNRSLDSNNELLVETFPFDVKDLSPRPLPFPIAPGATNEYLIVLFIIDPSSFSPYRTCKKRQK